MKPCSTSIGRTTDATAPCSSGELSPTQRAILASIRNDGPGTEAEVHLALRHRKRGTLDELRADLRELESRQLVRCETQTSGRRIWGMA